MNDKYRIRVGVVILQNSKVLVVRMHRDNSDDIFVLPGGGVKLGENIFKAAIRETKEETNLKIKIKKIIYLKSLYAEEEGAIEIILLGDIADGTLKKGFDPEDKRKNILKEVKFVKLSEIKNLNFHPRQIKDLLDKDFKNSFSNECRYLGNFRYPEE